MNKDQKLISAIRFFLKKVLETRREGKCAMCECHGVCKTALGRTNAGQNYLPSISRKIGIAFFFVFLTI